MWEKDLHSIGGNNKISLKIIFLLELPNYILNVLVRFVFIFIWFYYICKFNWMIFFNNPQTVQQYILWNLLFRLICMYIPCMYSCTPHIIRHPRNPEENLLNPKLGNIGVFELSDAGIGNIIKILRKNNKWS